MNPVSNSFQGQHQGGRYLHEAHPCMDLDSRVVGQGTVRMPSPNSSGPSYQVRPPRLCSELVLRSHKECILLNAFSGFGARLLAGEGQIIGLGLM